MILLECVLYYSSALPNGFCSNVEISLFVLKFRSAKVHYFGLHHFFIFFYLHNNTSG